ncbi:class A sortase [Enterococcus hulanensis]|uniref:class A sortase n=1 Tax=Enterococcus hulanensis TaxID=2559929 RepID=UPI001A8CFDD0|nr:class A sortase [Enterococcus hulanensis]MBO0456607.1 class A sortase [Enterococcus hulanensis]
MKKIWRSLPFLWILLGLIVFGASYYGYQLLLHANEQAEQLTYPIESNGETKEKQKRKIKDAVYCPRQIKPVTPKTYAKAQLHYTEILNQWGIGALFIPSANIHSKILAGMANQNLMVGVGTYYKDQQLSRGNYVLLAHNLVQGGGTLKNLPKISLQEVIYATDFTNVYEYQATKNEVVPASRGDVLAVPDYDKPAVLTLIRCEGGINTFNRAIVQGEFLKVYPVSKASDSVKLGLGLVQSHLVIDDTMISSQNKSSETKGHIQAKKGSKLKRQKTRYSPVQTLCISLFTVLNEFPFLMGISYFLGLLVLTHIATRKQVEFKKIRRRLF